MFQGFLRVTGCPKILYAPSFKFPISLLRVLYHTVHAKQDFPPPWQVFICISKNPHLSQSIRPFICKHIRLFKHSGWSWSDGERWHEPLASAHSCRPGRTRNSWPPGPGCAWARGYACDPSASSACCRRGRGNHHPRRQRDSPGRCRSLLPRQYGYLQHQKQGG